MPLKGIPSSITPELLYCLAKMGHGDSLVIADSNFPSDSTAKSCTPITEPIRVSGSTSEVLAAVLSLMPLDQYMAQPVQVMDKVDSDKARALLVPAYALLQEAAAVTEDQMEYVERFEFYKRAQKAFAIVQTNDKALYANVIVTKGVI